MSYVGCGCTPYVPSKPSLGAVGVGVSCTNGCVGGGGVDGNTGMWLDAPVPLAIMASNPVEDPPKGSPCCWCMGCEELA